jgi:hypothetical protein
MAMQKYYPRPKVMGRSEPRDARLRAYFIEANVPHLRVTPTRTARMTKHVTEELEAWRGVLSASGWSVCIAVNVCEDRGWGYVLKCVRLNGKVVGYSVRREG